MTMTEHEIAEWDRYVEARERHTTLDGSAWDAAFDAARDGEDTPELPDGARALARDPFPQIDVVPKHTCNEHTFFDCDACWLIHEITDPDNKESA